MKKYILVLPANTKGLQDFSLVTKALNDPRVAAVFDYTVEYNIVANAPETEQYNRVTWFFRYEQGMQK